MPSTVSSIWGYVGIGRRSGLKIRWCNTVRVQVPLPLPTHADSLMLTGIYQSINRKLTRNSCISSDNCSDEAHNFNPLQGLLVCCYIRPNKLNRNSIHAVMAKLAYARDSKSLSRNTVRVRISITAPKFSYNRYIISKHIKTYQNISMED